MQTIKTQNVFEGFFKVEKVTLKNEAQNNSKEFDLLNIVGRDAVAAVVFNKDTNELIFTNQFRYSAFKRLNQQTILEIPAGCIESGENILTSLKRELIEEIGYSFKDENVFHLSTYFPIPGTSQEMITLFLVIVSNEDKVAEGGGLKEENEFITIQTIHINDIQKHIANGDIQDGKTLLGITQFLLKKQTI